MSRVSKSKRKTHNPDQRAPNPQRHWDEDHYRDNNTRSSQNPNTMMRENPNYNFSYNNHIANVVNYPTFPQSRRNPAKPKELQVRPTSDVREAEGLKSMARKIST